MYISTLSSSGQITIPVSVREALRLRAGDEVAFQEENGRDYFDYVCADGNGGWLYAYGGTNVFAGGSLEAGGFYVGDSKNNNKQSGSLTFSGKVRMAAIGTKSCGSGTINSWATS